MNCFRVHLAPRVIETIEDELANTVVDHDFKVVETGGWLWSRQDSNWWSEGVEVLEASGPGLGAEKTYDSLTLPEGHLLDLDLLFRAEGLEIAGNWHFQPTGDQPSDQDFNCIEMLLGLREIWKARTPRALMLIVNRIPGTGVKATPWIFRRGPGSISGSEGTWPAEAAILENRRD